VAWLSLSALPGEVGTLLAAHCVSVAPEEMFFQNVVLNDIIPAKNLNCIVTSKDPSSRDHARQCIWGAWEERG
jgi:hypothetical protein